MSERIYAVSPDGALVELDEAPYESEDVLQELIDQHPDLLAGEQMDAGTPRRWVVVTREMGVADQQDAADRWAMDHLLLDQDATPTFVEVKRARDTRIRREVVGQMLDYAANAVAYANSERIRAEFEARVDDPRAEILALCGSDGIADEDDFWARVELNLRAERVRLVFVADELPTELKRIIEFLNGQMQPAEVVGVELKQFVGEGVRILVPRVVGISAPSRAPRRSTRAWDRESFMEDATRRHGSSSPMVETAVRVLDLAEQEADAITGGHGASAGSLYARLTIDEDDVRVIALWTSGALTVQFGDLARTSAFETRERREEVADRLNQIQGVEIPEGRIDKYPSFDLAVLASSDAFEQFEDTFRWICAVARAGHGEGS